MSAAEFDRYCTEHDVCEEDIPAAFAAWLARQTGEAVFGGPVGEPPNVAALPPSDHDEPDA